MGRFCHSVIEAFLIHTNSFIPSSTILRIAFRLPSSSISNRSVSYETNQDQQKLGSTKTQKLGRGGCHFHRLRNSRASGFLFSSEPLKVAPGNLGHASIAITADLYTQVASSIQKQHIENLGKLRIGQVTQDKAFR
jgi:site-specific recombinase XerC